jgi:hypothetical protein
MPSRSKIPKGKVQINPLISRDLYETLLKYIGVSNKARGVISEIVEEALRLYFRVKPPQGGVGVSPGGATHTHTTQKSVYGKVEEIKEVFNAVLDMHKRLKNIPSSEIICEITRQDLSTAITFVRGSDERTIEKWIKNFLNADLLRGQNQEKPEKSNVFKVVDSACLEIADYLVKEQST